MRKVTHDVCKAFVNGNARAVGNSHTSGDELFLHGNRIAWRDPDGRTFATLCGWPTVTTRERLNGLCELLGLGRPFYQNRHRQYFRQDEINSTDVVELA